MDRTNRATRLSIGFGCLGVAVVVAIIGYLGLSRNPDVNRQIPYLASAGMAVVILASVGGAFIVAEQLRNALVASLGMVSKSPLLRRHCYVSA